jgi:hypothetical protein
MRIGLVLAGCAYVILTGVVVWGNLYHPVHKKRMSYAEACLKEEIKEVQEQIEKLDKSPRCAEEQTCRELLTVFKNERAKGDYGHMTCYDLAPPP